jgi:hypothetical protein
MAGAAAQGAWQAIQSLPWGEIAKYGAQAAQTGAAIYGASRAGDQQNAGYEAALGSVQGSFDWLMNLEDPEEMFTWVDPLATTEHAQTLASLGVLLGQPQGVDIMRGSPYSQALSIAGSMGYDLTETGGGHITGALKIGAQALGLHPHELKAEQERWAQEWDQWLTDVQPARDAMMEGRVEGYKALGNMLASAPDVTREGFERERGIQKEGLFAEIERNRQLGAREIGEQAQRWNTNPAFAQGELQERTQVQRQQAEADAIGRAIGIQTGQSNVYAQTLGALAQALQNPITLAGQMAGQTGNQLNTLGQISASQAQAINRNRTAMTMQQRQITADMIMQQALLEAMEGQSQSTATMAMTGALTGGMDQLFGLAGIDTPQASLQDLWNLIKGDKDPVDYLQNQGTQLGNVMVPGSSTMTDMFMGDLWEAYGGFSGSGNNTNAWSGGLGGGLGGGSGGLYGAPASTGPGYQFGSLDVGTWNPPAYGTGGSGLAGVNEIAGF